MQFAAQMANYMYVIVNASNQAVLVDACWDVEGILDYCRTLGVSSVIGAVWTHRHFDHTGGKLPPAMTGGREVWNPRCILVGRVTLGFAVVRHAALCRYDSPASRRCTTREFASLRWGKETSTPYKTNQNETTVDVDICALSLATARSCR
jgi:hypothetical protein